jgi:hypothetical protein
MNDLLQYILIICEAGMLQQMVSEDERGVLRVRNKQETATHGSRQIKLQARHTLGNLYLKHSVIEPTILYIVENQRRKSAMQRARMISSGV